MKKKKTQKKKSSKKSSNSFYKYIIFSLIVIIIALLAFISGYVINQKESKKEIKKYQNTLITLQKKIDQLSKEIKKNTHKNKQIKNSEIVDYMQASKYHNTSAKETFTKQNEINKKIKTKKPKLVIIIDDVAFKYEVNLIKSIPYHITPSFFPSTKRHPYTPIFAREFKDYMIHVPMQAIHFAHPESDTLLADDSYYKIKSTIDKLKKEFPNAHFINNHTGSKFTSNLQAMNYLFIALKKDHLGFVDSKTTPNSKSKIVDTIYKIPLFQRDIFLDNKQNPQYIRNQLRKAVKLAKKRGYAIAIGHPHKITLETIKNSKDILNQVDVVYIDELAKYAKN